MSAHAQQDDLVRPERDRAVDASAGDDLRCYRAREPWGGARRPA
jgi:hypothetical protein